MTKIKICGITKLQEIDLLNSAKVDYAGFVFAESKRKVSPNKVVELCKELDPRIKKVGVFVNQNEVEVIDTVVLAGLHSIQLHGDENQEYLFKLKNMLSTRINREIEIWKAIRVKDENSLEEIAKIVTNAYVLDSFSPSSYGGNGKAFDWNLAKNLESSAKIIAAGGLNNTNVTQVISALTPFGVDVSSGVEVDGQKDGSLINEFVKLVREYGR